MTAFVNDTGKWVLNIGIHQGTITSRDMERTEHEDEAQARQAYQDAKRQYASFGCQIWFARMIAPGAPYDTGWVSLDAGAPYRS